MRRLIVFVVLSGLGALSQAQDLSSVARTHRLAVEITDTAGVPIDDPRLVDLEVYLGDERVEGRAVSAGDGWQVTLVFDRLLSESRMIHTAALDLSEVADELVGLGEVEVVVGGDEFTRAVLPTRDAEQLRQALTWMRIRESGDGAQLEIRRQFDRDFDVRELAQEPYAAVSATATQTLAELRFGVRRAIQEEVALIERQRRLLLDWLLENRRGAPSLLILVTPGSDDPVTYYRSVLDQVGLGEAVDEDVIGSAEPGDIEMGKTLSALGWITVVYAPGSATALGADGGGGPEIEPVETVMQDGELVDRTMIGGFDPRKLFRRRGDATEARLTPDLLAPLASLAEWVDASGGELVTNRQTLGGALKRLAGRVHVDIADDSVDFSVQPVRVEYPENTGRELAPPRARRWISGGTPEPLAEIRASRLLADGIEEGPLLVSAHLVTRGGEDRVAVEIEPTGDDSSAIGAGPLRLTAATLDDQERGVFRHSIIDVERGGRDVGGGPLALEERLDLPSRATGPVVVVIEDLSTGRWGGTYATLIGDVDGELADLLLPLPRVVHLLEPEDQMVLGSTLFQVVHDPEVQRVDFYLDGELVTQLTTPPFATRLDLGRLPEPHRIEVVAFDAQGRELGRDRLSLNESGGIFRVRILRPRQHESGSSKAPLTGPVIVEAQVETPRTSAVSKVEYFWNDSLRATRYAAPFVQRIPVPADEPQGFFRVVAYLEDGSTAEDVVFVNSPGGSERVKVELIQLYAVVTDRDGRPFQGLNGESFRVLEDGVEQEIAAFNEAKDQPLTVGLAIDASASMFVKLPRVQKAAGSFLDGLDETKDRAFVVDFGTEPRLHHDTSKDLGAVEEALFSLVPEGRTAIWKGIAFSLVQLQGVPGKKALIVFSDGADEDPDFSFRTCLKFAQRVGVPIYVIVSNDEIYRTRGRGLNVRGFINRLESLTRSVGGRVYFSRVGEDLEDIYAQIDDELRSQYLLGYYARDTDEDRWRSVRVEVDVPGARARTVSGYFR